MHMPGNFSPIRFSTECLPDRDRVPVWREFFGRLVLGTEIEPAPDVPFHANVTVRRAPGLELVSSTMSPLRQVRTPALMADGNDDVGLVVSSSGGVVSWRGREIASGAGGAVVTTAAEAATWTAQSAARYFCLHIRRAELKSLVASLDPAAVPRLVTPDSEALQYLLGYMRFLQSGQVALSADVARAAAAHLRDLFALLLGAAGDAAVVAKERGLRAARLQAIKRYVADSLDDPGLSVAATAARHRVAPRYVQRLFESEGTTFSEYVLNERLARAYRMLVDPTHTGWTVSTIAFEAGFGDVSYFNRRFRRRYGMRPSEVRAAASSRA